MKYPPLLNMVQKEVFNLFGSCFLYLFLFPHGGPLDLCIVSFCFLYKFPLTSFIPIQVSNNPPITLPAT